jgi:mono/diheme cytochrome c family protein
MITPLKTLITLVFTVPVACLCGASEGAGTLKATFAEADTPEVAEIRKLGEAAINRLATQLVREVTSAMAKDGPEGAVETCHLKAVPITNGTVAGLPRITAMKRTSFRLRSPANAPDAAEKIALDHIQQLLDNGDSPPPLLVQRVEAPPAAPEWRVYKPLGIMPKCLACHGDSAGQSEALKTKLAALYPGDKASNYSAGEWRGLIRVTVADAPAK